MIRKSFFLVFIIVILIISFVNALYHFNILGDFKISSAISEISKLSPDEPVAVINEDIVKSGIVLDVKCRRFDQRPCGPHYVYTISGKATNVNNLIVFMTDLSYSNSYKKSEGSEFSFLVEGTRIMDNAKASKSVVKVVDEKWSQKYELYVLYDEITSKVIYVFDESGHKLLAKGVLH